MGERLECWLLLSLYGVESLGLIVALINPVYLNSDYVPSGLCLLYLSPGRVCWPSGTCSTIEPTVGPISVRVVTVTILFFLGPKSPERSLEPASLIAANKAGPCFSNATSACLVVQTTAFLLLPPLLLLT
jgi:hypothetical protein